MPIGSRAASQRLNPWAHWVAVVGFLGLLVASVITLLDVVMRFVFSQPIEGWDDLSELVFAVAIVSAFPAGLLQGHNITIRFLGAGLGNRPTYWLELLGALLTFMFIAGIAWQFIVLVFEYRANNDTTMTAEILTWPWWALATFIILFCVPVQAVVLHGHFKRAVDGGGPGGTIDVGEGASHGGEV